MSGTTEKHDKMQRAEPQVTLLARDMAASKTISEMALVVEEEPAVLGEYTPGTSEEKALVRKIDCTLIPALFLMYLLNFLDRSNIGNAKIAGMDRDLELTGDKFDWVLSIFYFGYVLGEVPSNMMLSRSRPSVYLPCLMLSWGIISGLMSLSNSYSTMLALRFLLGIIEAGFVPGVIFVVSSWYCRRELARRIAIFYCASLLAGAFGGLIAGAVTARLDGARGVAGWRYLFIIEGSATVLVSLLSFFVLPEFPGTPSRRFTAHERTLVLRRLAHDGAAAAGGDGAPTHRAAFAAAAADWRTWAFAVLYTLTVTAGTISFFIPTLMEALGHRGAAAQFMTAPIYAVAGGCCVCWAASADRWEPDRRRLHIAGALALAAAGAVAAALAARPPARYAALCVVAAGAYSATPLVLVWVGNAFAAAPPETRAVAIAVVNGFGNLSAVYGSRLWPDRAAPRYCLGFGVSAGFLAAGAAAAVGLGVALQRRAKRAAAAAAVARSDGRVAGLASTNARAGPTRVPSQSRCAWRGTAGVAIRYAPTAVRRSVTHCRCR